MLFSYLIYNISTVFFDYEIRNSFIIFAVLEMKVVIWVILLICSFCIKENMW